MKVYQTLMLAFVVLAATACQKVNFPALTDNECESLKEDSKYSCYLHKAEYANEVGFCESSGYLRDKCIVALANMNQNYSLCNHLTGSAPKDAQNMEEYAQQNLENASGKCSMLSNAAKTSMVQTQDNEKYTKISPLAQSKNSCIKEVNYRIAIAKNNGSLCEETIQKQQCFYLIGKKTHNISLCKKVTFPLEKEDCIINAALNLNNPDLCNEAFLTDRCKEAVEKNQKFEVSSFYKPYLIKNGICT